MEKYRLLLEIVSNESLKEIQKKLNQWMTVKLLVKFDTVALADGSILFKIILKKEAQ
jgi:hypothetical protein